MSTTIQGCSPAQPPFLRGCIFFVLRYPFLNSLKSPAYKNQTMTDKDFRVVADRFARLNDRLRLSYIGMEVATGHVESHSGNESPCRFQTYSKPGHAGIFFLVAIAPIPFPLNSAEMLKDCIREANAILNTKFGAALVGEEGGYNALMFGSLLLEKQGYSDEKLVRLFDRPVLLRRIGEYFVLVHRREVSKRQFLDELLTEIDLYLAANRRSIPEDATYIRIGNEYLVGPELSDWVSSTAQAARDDAKAAFRSGNIQAAITGLQAAIRAEPRWFDPYYTLGICFDAIGDRQKAAECYEKAIDLEPSWAPAYFNLAQFLRTEYRRIEPRDNVAKEIYIFGSLRH